MIARGGRQWQSDERQRRGGERRGGRVQSTVLVTLRGVTAVEAAGFFEGPRVQDGSQPDAKAHTRDQRRDAGSSLPLVTAAYPRTMLLRLRWPRRRHLGRLNVDRLGGAAPPLPTRALVCLRDELTLLEWRWVEGQRESGLRTWLWRGTPQ